MKMSKKVVANESVDKLKEEETAKPGTAGSADEAQSSVDEAAEACGEPEEESEDRSGDQPGAGADADDEAEAAPEKKEDDQTRYLRLAADFQNYKKRSEKEKSDIYAYANEKFAKGLLEVLDNFERALEQANDDSAEEPFRAGMEMILSQLRNLLSGNDIEEIAALGEAFDPNFHHAVIMDESDSAESGTVTEVMQKGYKMKDRVIRPSMVKVAK